jgi:hypothetical protein
MNHRIGSILSRVAASQLVLLVFLTLFAPRLHASPGLVVNGTWPDDVNSIALDVAGGDRSVAISPRSIAGHFVAEVALDTESGGGLVVMHDDHGRPDTRNAIAVEVSRDAQGRTVVRATDIREGKADVLDPTGQVDRARYQHVLDGSYSLPFERTGLRLRIARDAATGYFRLAYSVSKSIRGETVSGWISLAVVPGWSATDQVFRVGVLAPTQARTRYEHLRFHTVATSDRDDTSTGFAIAKRDYNWSGFDGEALVVTFDKALPQHALADGRSADLKFVFWSRANFVPVWHLSEQLLFSYQFLETWGGGGDGCYEPMSDRLLRWSRVEVVHDNPVRKVIRWRYVLCDPDYRVPDDEHGTDLPEVEELWTIYPDGTALRRMTYFPKLDTQFRNWHEVMEMIAIAGTRTVPSQHLNSPALTLADLGANRLTFHPGKSFDKQGVNQWNEFIAVTHFKSAPDAFAAVVNTDPLPDSLRPYPIRFDLDWHHEDFRMSHWPVETEPYQEAHKSHGRFDAEVGHTSLIGAGVWEGTDWNDRFQTDERGRRFRQWVSLVGLHRPNDLDGIRQRVRAWRDARSVRVLEGASPNVDFDHTQAHYTIRPTAESVRLTVGPSSDATKQLAALRLTDRACFTPRLKLAGSTLSSDQFRWASEGTDLIVHLHMPVDSDVELSIETSRQSR